MSRQSFWALFIRGSYSTPLFQMSSRLYILQLRYYINHHKRCNAPRPKHLWPRPTTMRAKRSPYTSTAFVSAPEILPLKSQRKCQKYHNAISNLGAVCHLGHHSEMISTTVRPQTHSAPTYKLSAKSSNPRPS